MTVRVVIADDHELVRSGLRALLERSDDITVVGEARDGQGAVHAARRLQPRVVLMDVRMPGIDGIEATRAVVEDPALQDVRVIVLTTFQDDEVVLGAIRAGAVGFVLKDASPDELRQAVRVVASGNSHLSPSVTQAVFAHVASSAGADPVAVAQVTALTQRERDVLSGIARGLTNTEIASELHITPATARTYASRLLARLEARDRTQLVILAYKAGFVGADE